MRTTDDDLDRLRQAWLAWFGDTSRAVPTDVGQMRRDVEAGLDATEDEAAAVVRPDAIV
jgi:hypothetical protein